MGIFDKLIEPFTTPAYIVPITSNLNNNIYFDTNNGGQIFQNISAFIAKEFTKSKIVLDNVPNRQRLDYMLNLRPNEDQTANEVLYTFALGLLKNGYIYYKVVGSAKAPEKLYISLTNKTGYKQYKQDQLKLRLPSRLNAQYTKLINNLSTEKRTSRLHLKTTLRFKDADFNAQAEERLRLLVSQAENAGGFVSSPNEEITSVPMDIVQPKADALSDLKTLIYEHLNLSPEILSGGYNEVQYRAFYGTHLAPVSMAFEEFLNYQFLTYEAYIAGSKISVILDLMQTASLESFTEMARQGIYNGYLSPDEARQRLGLMPIANGLGGSYFTNKNALILAPETLPYLTNPNYKGTPEGSNTNEE